MKKILRRSIFCLFPLLLMQGSSAFAVTYGQKTWNFSPYIDNRWDDMGGIRGVGTGSDASSIGYIWANSGWAWMGYMKSGNQAWDIQTHYYNCRVDFKVWDNVSNKSSGSNTSSYQEVINPASWTYIVPKAYHYTVGQWGWEHSSKFTPGESVYLRQIDVFSNGTPTFSYLGYASMTCDYWFDPSIH